MKFVSIGGGPAALYFAILLKKTHPRHEITIFERHRPADTFGFGVVFSDATMENLEAADPKTFEEIRKCFHHWDDIEIHYRGELLRSTGHGFSGISRAKLLNILAARAESLGVEIRRGVEISRREDVPAADLLLGADGANSLVRSWYEKEFRPAIDVRPNKFVWLGTTRPFPAFTFDFREDAHGLWRLHAYQYETAPVHAGAEPRSTFIVEARDQTFAASGLSETDEEATIAFCSRIFSDVLQGHGLAKNRSIWRSFPTIRNERWHCGNVVLIGDAAHTAHFSVGSGTKLAMEDSIALAQALEGGARLEDALDAYEAERRPPVESLQRAAQASLQWFEDTERYMQTEPIQFGFNLLTRSLRITHEDLRIRDPAYIESIDAWFAAKAEEQSGVPAPTVIEATAPRGGAPRRRVAPPMLMPFRLRDLLLPNRVVVSAMCQYSAGDGTPDDWHLVHLGSRAIGGAGLVMSEMTNVSASARISPGCTGMYKPEHVAMWKRITEFVHRHSPAKIGMQLGHGGRKGATTLEWLGTEPIAPSDGGWPLLAPSSIPWSERSQVPKEMTRQDMNEVRDDFVRATHMALEAGFDLLELHCAHGYLLASFISPLTNQRTDEYGGSLENRMRFPLEVFDAIRGAWPQEKPLAVRISAVDWAPNGMQPQNAVEVARHLKAHDCDLTDVSAGQTVPYQSPRYGRLFQTPFADRIRHEVGIPTMAVGAISSFMDVNTILASGRADLCALARAHLWDPYWTRHAAYDAGVRMPWPDPYSTIDEYNPRFR
jgi:anthraniloyl-CoA monooxygenase